VPIDRLDRLSSSNTLVAKGKFWEFNRLMIFDIGMKSQQTILMEAKAIDQNLTKTRNIQVDELASWAM
jgi:hypothetical protein